MQNTLILPIGIDSIIQIQVCTLQRIQSRSPLHEGFSYFGEGSPPLWHTAAREMLEDFL